MFSRWNSKRRKLFITHYFEILIENEIAFVCSTITDINTAFLQILVNKINFQSLTGME